MADAVLGRSLPAPGDEELDRVLILGLGNPTMADDGIGPEVVSRLEARGLPSGVRLVVVDGDLLSLVDLWRGEPEVWLVDAVSGNRPPGSQWMIDDHQLRRLPSGELSVHHPNVGNLLGWMLHARPEMAAVRFRLYGIEAARVRPGIGLDRAVETAIGTLVDRIAAAARGVTLSPHGRSSASHELVL
jgi:hydrogenase maturation protease